MSSVGVIGIVILGVLLLGIIIFKAMWRVAEPNEALVISGLRERMPDGVAESLGFKIVTGKGTLVMPGVQAVRRLSLDLREAELSTPRVTPQAIPGGIKGVVIFRVATAYTPTPTAPRRFLDQQGQMENR